MTKIHKWKGKGEGGGGGELQVRRKSCLPKRKIYMPETMGWYCLRALLLVRLRDDIRGICVYLSHHVIKP